MSLSNSARTSRKMTFPQLPAPSSLARGEREEGKGDERARETEIFMADATRWKGEGGRTSTGATLDAYVRTR